MIVLSEKEQAVVERLAKRFGLSPDNVIQVLATLAADESAKRDFFCAPFVR